MDSLKRAFSIFLKGPSFEMDLLNATYDDTSKANEAHLIDVHQALLGCNQNVTPEQAIDQVVKRLKENWTWKVVLKIVLLLNYILKAPQSSAEWLQNLFGLELEIFKSLKKFREGENIDPQAECHAAVIRRFSTYLEAYCKTLFHQDLGKKHNLYQLEYHWSRLDNDELFRNVRFTLILLSCAIEILVIKDEKADKVVQLKRFSDLSAQVCTTVLKDGLDLYNIINISMMIVLDRVPQMEPSVVEEAQTHYDEFRDLTRRLITLSTFVKNLPSMDASSIPSLDIPPLRSLATSGNRSNLCQTPHFEIVQTEKSKCRQGSISKDEGIFSSSQSDSSGDDLL